MTSRTIKISSPMADQTSYQTTNEQTRLGGGIAARVGLGANLDAERRFHDKEMGILEILSSIPAAIYVCDAEGRISYYNRVAAALFGLEPHLNSNPLTNGCNIEEVDILPAYGLMKTVLAKGDAIINHEVAFERPNACIEVLANIAPLRDSNGKVKGAISVFQDISELKKAQKTRDQLLEELKRSNQELSQFSYAVAHDLQGPVRSVRVFTELLVRCKDSAPAKVADLAAQIEQASENMCRLIDSLLHYALAGRGELDRQHVSAEEILEAVQVSLAESIAESGACLSNSDLPTICCDPVLFHRLLQNLIANAIKYGRPGIAPVIEIWAEPDVDSWRFAVKDNGEGISSQHHALIFQPLKRLHGSDLPGSGLGLALCNTIIERHGGRIWVESQGPGHGATFLFTLPKVGSADGAD